MNEEVQDAMGMPWEGPLPSFNVELAKQALKWATAEQEAKIRGEMSRWRQGLWIAEVYVRDEQNEFRKCGTAGCIAGWVVQEAGYTPVPEPSLVMQKAGFDSERGPLYLSGGLGASVQDPDNGAMESVPVVARELLGLTAAEADMVFRGSNTLSHIEGYFRRIAEHRGMQW